MPSCGEYSSWNDCISKNQDKEDPKAYCGKIKHETEDFDASKCVFKRMDCLEKKYPNMFDLRTKLTMSYDYCNSDLKERHDFGNGLFFDYVEDLVGRNTLKKLLEYQKVKSIWNDIRTIQSPRLVDKENGIGRIGKLYLKKFQNDLLTEDASIKPITPLPIQDPNQLLGQKEGNMPLEPVMSSTVMARGVADNKLYVRFHSSPSNTYKYEFDTNQEALQAAEEMVNESPGRWVWENLRGHIAGSKVTPDKLGHAWASKNLTIGGIGSSGYIEHPYEKIGLVIQKIDEVPGMEETAERLRKFKTEVKAKGEGATSAEPIRPEELKEYQEEIYKEKEKRKVVNEEVKGMIEKLRKKTLNRDLIIEDSEYPKSKGKWVTIKGRHIFVPDGQELQFEKDGTFKVSGDDNNKKGKKKSGNDIKDRNALRERIRYLRNKLQDESLKKPEKKEINDEIAKLRKMLKGLMFNKDFLVEDYPVEQYERTSPKGTKHEVKAHTRGEGKNLEKREPLPPELKDILYNETDLEEEFITVHSSGFAKQIKRPNKLYHATPQKNLEIILKEGLIPKKGSRTEGWRDNPKAIYLTSSKEEALLYAEEKGVILEFDLDRFKDDYEFNFFVGLSEDLSLNQFKDALEFWFFDKIEPEYLKKIKTDMLVEDSMDALVQWVLSKKLTSDPKEAEEIAFAIANSNKKSKQQSQLQAKKSTIQEVGESYSKSQENEWESTWSEIGESFTKQRLERKKERHDITQDNNDSKEFDEIIEKVLEQFKEELSEEDYESIENKLNKWITIPPKFFSANGQIKDFLWEINDYLNQNEVIPIYREIIISEKQFNEIKEGKRDPGEYWALFPEGSSIYHEVKTGKTAVSIELIPTNSIDRVNTLRNILNDYNEWEVKFKDNNRKTLKRDIFYSNNKNAQFFYDKSEELKEEYENKQFESESKSEGEGKGWFGESERHSKARKEGHADLTETSLLEDISTLLVELKKYDFDIDDNIDDLKNFLIYDTEEGRWITKGGRHIFIGGKKPEYYTVEELNRYTPKGKPIHEVEPWLKISKDVDIKNNINIGIINRELEYFPSELKQMIKEIRVYNSVGEDPLLQPEKDVIPEDFKAIGLNTTIGDVSGIYFPAQNIAIIKATTWKGTMRHELAHAVWYGMPKEWRVEWRRIHDSHKYILKEEGMNYEANDLQEFFAESFDKYYDAAILEMRYPSIYKDKLYEASELFDEVKDFFKSTFGVKYPPTKKWFHEGQELHGVFA